jgi:hypothetical protein
MLDSGRGLTPASPRFCCSAATRRTPATLRQQAVRRREPINRLKLCTHRRAHILSTSLTASSRCSDFRAPLAGLQRIERVRSGSRRATATPRRFAEHAGPMGAPPRFDRAASPWADTCVRLRWSHLAGGHRPNGSSSAGSDEPGFVGKDDDLDAVAEVELREDVGDVALDCRLAEVQLSRDLRVRQSARDGARDLELAPG